MKTFLLLFISLSASAQFPLLEEFNSGTGWTFTNGAGIQNYGLIENLATTNIGNTPYPNNSNITITSPVFILNNCLSIMTATFPLNGRIESNLDFLRFQYRTGVGPWITVQSFTGIQNITFISTGIIPTTATQFRFLLETSATGNTFGPPGNPSVYYYDIARFTVLCSAVLPLDITSFQASEEEGFNRITWSAENESETIEYEVENSTDGIEWDCVAKTQLGAGSYELKLYEFDKTINYYRLIAVHLAGSSHNHPVTLSIDNRAQERTVIGVTDILGQKCIIDAKGLVIVWYSDGSTIKILNQ